MAKSGTLSAPALTATLFSRSSLLIALLILLTVVLRLPALEVPFDNDSGAIAYHARLIIAGEPLYSTHHPNHHLPATYYLYAFAFTLFEDATWAVKLFLMFWTTGVVLLLYQLGKLVINEWAGFIGACFYSLMSSQVHMDGLTGQIELFANLPRVLGVFLLIWVFQKRSSLIWVWGCIAALAVTTILFKAVYVSLFALMGVIWLMLLWREWPEWKPGVWRIVWSGVGVTAVLLLLSLHLTVTDTWEGFLYVFELGSRYVSNNSQHDVGIPIWLAYPVLPILGLSANNPALLVTGFVGFVMAVWHAEKVSVRLLALWFFFSFVVASINLNYYTHYYLLIIPPLSLMSAWLIFQMARQLPSPRNTYLVVALASVVVGAGLYYESPFYRQYFAYRAGDITLREAIQEGTNYSGASANVARDVADYIHAHTEPDEQFYSWTSHIHMYYMSERRTPAYIIWPLYINDFPAQETLLGEQTRYVVIEKEHFPPPSWFQQQLAEMYVLETTIQKHDIYRFIGSTS